MPRYSPRRTAPSERPAAPTDANVLLHIEEAAEVLGVSRQTVHNWASVGVQGQKLKLIPVGASYRVRWGTLVDFNERARARIDAQGGIRRRRRKSEAAAR